MDARSEGAGVGQRGYGQVWRHARVLEEVTWAIWGLGLRKGQQTPR